MDISSQINIEGAGAPADPAGGLRFHQSDQKADIFEFGANGSEISLAQTDFNPYPTLDYAGVKQVSNVHRRESRLSRDQAEVLINGKTVLKTAKGTF